MGKRHQPGPTAPWLALGRNICRSALQRGKALRRGIVLVPHAVLLGSRRPVNAR